MVQRWSKSLLASYAWRSNVPMAKRLKILLIRPNASKEIGGGGGGLFEGELAGRKDKWTHHSITIRYLLYICDYLEIILCFNLFLTWFFYNIVSMRTEIFVSFVQWYVLSRSCSINIWIKKETDEYILRLLWLCHLLERIRAINTMTDTSPRSL